MLLAGPNPGSYPGLDSVRTGARPGRPLMIFSLESSLLSAAPAAFGNRAVLGGSSPNKTLTSRANGGRLKLSQDM